MLGMKLEMEGDTPRASYLIQWKQTKPQQESSSSSSSPSEGQAAVVSSDMTWEPATNLSEDVIREYEDKWWSAAKKVTTTTIGRDG